MTEENVTKKVRFRQARETVELVTKGGTSDCRETDLNARQRPIPRLRQECLDQRRLGDYTMDTLERLRTSVESVLIDYTKIPYSHGDFRTEAVFDRTRDRYVLMNVGWDSGERVHGCLVHIDIIEGKLWIQRDGTEHGIVKELVQSGVPKNQIVLAFRPPEVRRLTEYAVA